MVRVRNHWKWGWAVGVMAGLGALVGWLSSLAG